MQTTHTFYHDPEQNLLHHITCKVNDDGSHTVVESTISTSDSLHVAACIRAAANDAGWGNVRAYTITPMKEV